MPDEPSWFEVLKALFQKSPEEHLAEFTEELSELISEAEREGLFTAEEREIVLAVLKLRRVAVRELMIPRKELVALPVDWPMEKIWEVISKSPHSYYPVYEENLDNFLGVVSLKDLASHFGQDFRLKELVRLAYVIPESLKVREALKGFRDRGESVALVIDELGSLSGMIRLKDLLEFLFPVKRIGFPEDREGWYHVNPETPIEEIERVLKIELPRGDFETLAGLITDKLGRLPHSGERVSLPGLEVEVLQADERAVRALRVRPSIPPHEVQ
ncbi:transporter associated domain-containing protein [Thermosulfurimonas dismutans]|uniref:CBS domain containing protein n=2 Tax=Thermosulfurimonas dismutans TaxID=999894 RepID=A0A179D3H6_9BACT|nr:transporter associated domain-containing protein [Thermosulfurimonas dismutans]OAQ20596.1 CBS domain containing protein [Thermosulfurimonas dismutans]